MTRQVPAGTCDPYCQHRWQRILGAFFRELGRLPSGRLFCPSRLQEEPRTALAAALPVLALPETLLANVLSLAGLLAMLNASLSCRASHRQVWDSPFLWRALLQAYGISPAALIAAGLADDRQQRPPPARAFRDFARHWLSGIHLLSGIPTNLRCSLVCSHGVCKASGPSFEFALKAILAMRIEDGASLIQNTVDAVANLLLSRCKGDAEVLLDAVASRADIFTTAQMLHILGARQKAMLDDDVLTKIPKYNVSAQRRNCRGQRSRHHIVSGPLPREVA